MREVETSFYDLSAIAFNKSRWVLRFLRLSGNQLSYREHPVASLTHLKGGRFNVVSASTINSKAESIAGDST